MTTDLISTAIPTTQDALQMLRMDHRRLRALFADYERLGEGAGQGAPADCSGVISRLGALLRAHLQVTFEVFYPALKLDSEQLADARAERADILADLEALASDDVARDVKGMNERMAALAGQIEAHIDENEAHVFPQADGLDLRALGARMAQLRGELLGDQGAD